MGPHLACRSSPPSRLRWSHKGSQVRFHLQVSNLLPNLPARLVPRLPSQIVRYPPAYRRAPRRTPRFPVRRTPRFLARHTSPCRAQRIIKSPTRQTRQSPLLPRFLPAPWQPRHDPPPPRPPLVNPRQTHNPRLEPRPALLNDPLPRLTQTKRPPHQSAGAPPYRSWS